ncbi:MAG: HU family DNA-binding protein [Ruminococcaceae bacterium]|nr:HU family DNA-binding protein [Oscillospiraceae bacterium]
MKKTELIAAVAEKAGLQKKDADKAISAITSVIMDAVAAGDRVQIVGFGTFEVRTRCARKGRNPRTKEPIDIPASKLPVFKAGRSFKEIVEK